MAETFNHADTFSSVQWKLAIVDTVFNKEPIEWIIN